MSSKGDKGDKGKGKLKGNESQKKGDKDRQILALVRLDLRGISPVGGNNPDLLCSRCRYHPQLEGLKLHMESLV